MKRLYWYELEEADTNKANTLNLFTQIGGLGLTTERVLLGRNTNVNVPAELEMLGEDMTIKLDKGKKLANRLVTVRNIGLKTFTDVNKLPECFITSGEESGKDYFARFSNNFGDLIELVKDDSRFNTTDEGESTNSWNIAPLQILPIYDGEIDTEWGYWEMFEEEGFIYGLDKRTGNIFDLIHVQIEMKQAISANIARVEAFIISNEELLAFDQLDHFLPYNTAIKGLSKWVKNVIVQHSQYKLNQIIAPTTSYETLSVERYKL